MFSRALFVTVAAISIAAPVVVPSAEGASRSAASSCSSRGALIVDARRPHSFFSRGVGLWVERATAGPICIRAIPKGDGRPSTAAVAIPAASVGVAWLGQTRFLSDGRTGEREQVCQWGLDGTRLPCVEGRAIGVFRSGLVAIATGHRIRAHRPDGKSAALSSTDAVERVAGFRGELRSMESGTLGSWPGPFRADRIAFVVHASRGPFQERVIVMDGTGKLAAASPVFHRQGEVGSAVGGLYWTPDGQRLWESNTRPDPTGRWDHDHCLDEWSANGGYKRLFCASAFFGRAPYVRTAGHFVGIQWSPSRTSALLSNGWIVDVRGRPTGRILRGSNSGFAVAWSSG